MAFHKAVLQLHSAVFSILCRTPSGLPIEMLRWNQVADWYDHLSVHRYESLLSPFGYDCLCILSAGSSLSTEPTS